MTSAKPLWQVILDGYGEVPDGAGGFFDRLHPFAPVFIIRDLQALRDLGEAPSVDEFRRYFRSVRLDYGEPERRVDEHYDHILSVIRQHTRSMERDPQAYASMGEEARRRVILDALNTHYHGAGSAEGFNFGGKTDILITYEGRSLFIAECKFWSGASGFTETIDQLFGYQAWRDTKLAILMFVRERGLTTIIERAHSALAVHPQFVAWKGSPAETELRATVSWKGDEGRRADLAALFISTPME